MSNYDGDRSSIIEVESDSEVLDIGLGGRFYFRRVLLRVFIYFDKRVKAVSRRFFFEKFKKVGRVKEIVFIRNYSV